MVLMKPVNNYAFIDSQNLNLSVRDQGWKLDYARFRKYLLDKYNASKAFLFIGYVEENKGLYKYLQKIGYILVYKPTLNLPGGKPKGNVDAELVLYSAAIEYANYSKAVIVTGDGDFCCLIEFLKKRNKLLKLMVPNYLKYSSLLRKFMEDIVFMNGLKNKLSKR